MLFSKMKDKGSLLVWSVLVVALIAGVKYFHLELILDETLRWIDGLGVWAPAGFMAFYFLATLLSVPGSVLTIGAGLLFGFVWGSVYVSVASTLGATAAFLIGRYLARDWVAKKIGQNARFRAIDDAVGREGWKIVSLARLCPFFPFNIFKYAFGITKVSLRDYFLASWITMIPGTMMYVYIGSMAGGSGTFGQASWMHSAYPGGLFGAVVLGMIATAVDMGRTAETALKARLRA